MKKQVYIRILPDLLIILAASILSAVILTPQDTYLRMVNFVSILVFYLSVSFMLSFYFLGIYSKSSFKLYTKIKRPFLAACLSLVFVSFIFIMTNLSTVFFKGGGSSNIPSITQLQYSAYALAWFFSTLSMLISRTWIYFYSKANLSQYEQNKKSLNRNKVLVIGGAGYIGSSLIGKLLKEDYLVTVLDILFFGTEPIKEFLGHPNLTLIKADFRKVDDLVHSMQECHTVVHLGGIVGDPASAVDESLTTEVNLTSTKIIGQIAKAAGVKRLIFASSCSVYGDQEGVLDEQSKVNPLSLYAKTKIGSEHVLQELSSDDFSPVILRFSTVFGFSGRTRFDLVVNLLTAKSFVEKSMTVFGANQTRPFIHVSDAAESILLAIKAPTEIVHNEIFNIGSSSLNYTLLELATLIKEQVPDTEVIVQEPNEDGRNYHVSFNKAQKKLGFKTAWSLEEGIAQVIEKFKKGEIKDYSSPMYSNFIHMSESGKDVLGHLEYSGWEKKLLEAQDTSS